MPPGHIMSSISPKPAKGAKQDFNRFFENSMAAKLAGLMTDVRFALWRFKNPKGSFAEFYATTIAEKLKRGGVHKTLGARNYQTAGLIGQAAPQEGQTHGQRGRPFFNWVKQRGIKPEHICVDFGCGSLRVGQHFIGYLQPGNYLGLDIVDKFYQDGLSLLDKDMISTKSPWLGIISPETLSIAKSRQPDFIYSTAVMQHVPAQDLTAYLGNIFAMMNDRTMAATNFKVADMQTRIGANAWAHTEKTVADAVRRTDAAMPFKILRWSKDPQQRMLIASRSHDIMTQWP